MDKKITEMTTRELRAYIRKVTPEVNERLKSYEDALTAQSIREKPIIEERAARLKELGKGSAKAKARGGLQIGMGLAAKTKAELVQQARALEQFIEIDVYTPLAKSEREEKAKKAYQTFKRRQRTSLSFEAYKDLVELMGAAGSHIMNEFGNYEILKIYEEADEGKRANLLSEMIKVQKESKGKGWTNEDMVKQLRENIGLNENERNVI